MPAIPIENGLLPLFGSEAIEHALNGGEDYELLFAAPSVTVKKIQKEFHGDISVIGHVIESNIPGGKVTIRDAGGLDHEPRRKGWDHLNG